MLIFHIIFSKDMFLHIVHTINGMENINKEMIDQMNIVYAKEYSILNDMTILLKKWRFLDL